MTAQRLGRPATLSDVGGQMSQATGLRRVMEDIAISKVSDDGARWLNLSIGNPAALPEVTEMWRGLVDHASQTSFAHAQHYGPSRGTPELIATVSDYLLRHFGWQVGSENIVVGPGSQMLFFVAAALFTGPSAVGMRKLLLPMTPDYTGYQGLSMFPGTVVGIDGQIITGPSGFSYELDQDAAMRHHDAGMILISSPSNPSGHALSALEQDALTEVAERLDVPLFIDYAYGRPFPQIAPTLALPQWHPNIVNCFSMSKLGVPGERLGFAVGDPRFISPIVSFLSNSVLHAPRLMQMAAAQGLQSGVIDRVVTETVTPFYLERRLLAERLLTAAMPSGVDWMVHVNDGGMFAWVWVQADWFDDIAFYEELKRQRVFIAPGRYFFTGVPTPGAHAGQCFRLSLSPPEDVLAEGIRRIGETLTRTTEFLLTEGATDRD